MNAARLSAFLAGFSLLFLSVVAQAQNISCTCRYKGSDYGIGESICLKSPDGMKMATCSMVLNNTSWKFSNAPCPLSELKLENGSAPQSDALSPADGTFPILSDETGEDFG